MESSAGEVSPSGREGGLSCRSCFVDIKSEHWSDEEQKLDGLPRRSKSLSTADRSCEVAEQIPHLLRCRSRPSECGLQERPDPDVLLSTPTESLPELALLRHKFRTMQAALHRANQQQKDLQVILTQALGRLEERTKRETELLRERDHQHHRWCILDQEREGLQRVAQQAQVAERAARAGERAALEEATSWRKWLASFLDVFLRRGRDDPVAAVFGQGLQAQQHAVPELLTRLAAEGERTAAEAKLLEELPALFDAVVAMMANGGLSMRRDTTQEPAHHKEDQDEVGQLQRKLDQKELAIAALENEKRVLRVEVRSLQNLVQELRGSIRVFCRLRPPRHGPDSTPSSAAGAKMESSQRVVLRKPPGDRRHDFHFDRVFSESAKQGDLYEEMEPLLPGILEGIHVCVLAYGQTGSGKTYTLSGSPDGEGGIQDLAIADLLRLAQSRAEAGSSRFEVRISALEIYNETIQDLLSDASHTDCSPGGQGEGSKLEVRQSREANGSETPIDAACFGPSPFGSMRVPGLRTRLVRGQ